jgi:ADP-heptose:LPS heptosyltransferase
LRLIAEAIEYFSREPEHEKLLQACAKIDASALAKPGVETRIQDQFVTQAKMNIDKMRRIDRLAGVPLCFLATFLLRAWESVRITPERPVRRILFIELSEMGSTILAEPAMRKARARLQAELFFAIFERNVGSLELFKTISRSNVFTIRDDSFWHLTIDTLRFFLWTRRMSIDTVIDLELFSRFTGLLTGLSGADRRVGFYRFNNEGLYRGEMLTHRVAYNPHIHIAKNFIALMNALLSTEPQIPYSKTFIGDDELELACTPPGEESRTAIVGRIRALAPAYDPSRLRLVLVNPNASQLLPHRRWMPERFCDLIHRVLATYEDTFVLITGALEEREESNRLAATIRNSRCVSFAGHSELPDLPAIYALAAIMITNDSGPAHFAAATGLPTIVLFGPESPKLYMPLGNSRAIYAGLACSPCVSAHNHRKTACNDNLCMRAITVDEVFSEVTRVLSAPSDDRISGDERFRNS